MYWSFMSVAFLMGAMGSARMVKRLGRKNLLALMVGGSGAIGASYPFFVLLLDATPFTLIAPLVLLSLFLGFITPLTLSGAIATHPTMAGTASGLCGALTMAASALLTIAAGAFYDGTGLGLTWSMSGSMVSMLGFYLTLRVFERRTKTAL